LSLLKLAANDAFVSDVLDLSIDFFLSFNSFVGDGVDKFSLDVMNLNIFLFVFGVPLARLPLLLLFSFESSNFELKLIKIMVNVYNKYKNVNTH
jgi:hypothetical protein